MLAVYASIALLTAAALLIGRAVMSLRADSSWTGLEPAVGLAGLFAVSGFLARVPGQSRTITVGVALLIAAAALFLLVQARRAQRTAVPGRRDLLGVGVTFVIAVALLSIPFALHGRWGPLGIGVNNDFGLHLAWAEWLRSGLGPVPDAGYPIGPHGLAGVLARVPGIELAQAFSGIVMTITAVTAITALAAVRRIGSWKPVAFELTVPRAIAGGLLTALTYLAASYFVQSAFKETSEALFVLAFTLFLPLAGSALGRWHSLLVIGTLLLGIAFSYSFAGLAWPVAIGGLWAVTRPATWRALHPRRIASTVLNPFALAAAALAAVAAYAFVFSARYGFNEGFDAVAGSDTYGPVSPVEALGVWAESNYRLAATGWPDLAVGFGVIGAAALAYALVRLASNGRLILPVAIAACAIVYLASLPVSGDYSRAKALMIASPLIALAISASLLDAARFRQGTRRTLAVTALLAVWALGAAYSSFLVLRDASVAPPGHAAELQELIPEIGGGSVLYAGQDRYAAWALRGADAAVPLVEFPDERIEESTTKPFDTGSAYSPIDFDSFSPETLDRFKHVITGSAAWNSAAPANFREAARTDSFILWRREGDTPQRSTLIEGTEPAAPLSCISPEYRLFSQAGGRAGLMPEAKLIGSEEWAPGPVLAPGESATASIDLPAGRWRLSLQYFAPQGLTLEAGDYRRKLIPSQDGQRPAAISLENNGQYWPAGEIRWDGGRLDVRIQAPEPTPLQWLLDHEPKSYLGKLSARRAGERRTSALADACGELIDWYAETPFP